MELKSVFAPLFKTFNKMPFGIIAANRSGQIYFAPAEAARILNQHGADTMNRVGIALAAGPYSSVFLQIKADLSVRGHTMSYCDGFSGGGYGIVYDEEVIREHIEKSTKGQTNELLKMTANINYLVEGVMKGIVLYEFGVPTRFSKNAGAIIEQNNLQSMLQKTGQTVEAINKETPKLLGQDIYVKAFSEYSGLKAKGKAPFYALLMAPDQKDATGNIFYNHKEDEFTCEADGTWKLYPDEDDTFFSD